jgi:DNA-binding NtrC family response regulator
VSGQSRFRRPLRILFVEDDASVRRSLNRLVNALVHGVYVTQNMREALDLAVAENETFDLLLSDICLPDGDGRELLVKFQQRYQNSHRIVISGIVGYSLKC